MHWQEILPIIWLANTEIHIIADTDNWFDVWILHEFGKMVILKDFFGPILSKNIITVCKINWLISVQCRWPIFDQYLLST